jgi:transcriptional regulator with XRE-family HTH domain
MSDEGDPDGQSEPLFRPLDPSVFSNDLGQRIRSLRHGQGLTLEAISQRSGISIGALSQVERGKGNPAFFTLIKLAHALEVPLTTLLHIESGASPVVRSDARRPLAPHFVDHPGVEAELLTPDLDRDLQVCRYLLPKGARTESGLVHSGEEFLTVLRGELQVGVGDATHELAAGDSVSYAATVPHWFASTGDGDTEILFACTPPTF